MIKMITMRKWKSHKCLINKIKRENGQSAMPDFFMEPSLGREPLFNVGNLIGKSYHGNYPL